MIALQFKQDDEFGSPLVRNIKFFFFICDSLHSHHPSATAVEYKAAQFLCKNSVTDPLSPLLVSIY